MTAINWGNDYGIYGSTIPTDWQHVLTVSSGGGYDWQTFHAFYSPTSRRFYWHGAAGCSCNDWGDELASESGFQNGMKGDLERAVRAFTREYAWAFNAIEVVDAMDELHRWRADS